MTQNEENRGDGITRSVRSSKVKRRPLPPPTQRGLVRKGTSPATPSLDPPTSSFRTDLPPETCTNDISYTAPSQSGDAVFRDDEHTLNRERENPGLAPEYIGSGILVSPTDDLRDRKSTRL